MKRTFQEFKTQEVFFGTRTDGKFNDMHNQWYGVCSLLVQGAVNLPRSGHHLSSPEHLSASHNLSVQHNQVGGGGHSQQNGSGNTNNGNTK